MTSLTTSAQLYTSNHSLLLHMVAAYDEYFSFDSHCIRDITCHHRFDDAAHRYGLFSRKGTESDLRSVAKIVTCITLIVPIIVAGIGAVGHFGLWLERRWEARAQPQQHFSFPDSVASSVVGSSAPVTASVDARHQGKGGALERLSLDYFLAEEQLFPPTTVSLTSGHFDNVECVEKTAVKLADGTCVHANRLKVQGLGNQIMTQAPATAQSRLHGTDACEKAFWEMVLEEARKGKVLIVDLRSKDDRYAEYPSDTTLKRPDGDSEMSIRCTVGDDVSDWSTYHVTCGDASCEVQRRHYSKWIDHGTIGAQEILRLIEEVEKYEKEKDIQTTIVHCTAGIGRTGTFEAIRLLKLAIEQGRTTEQTLDKHTTSIIAHLRQIRAGSVQTPAQEEMIGDVGRLLLNRKKGVQ